MYNIYTRRQLQLMNLLRKLWSQHVYWTRFFIISTAADLDDLDDVTARLLRNPSDFAAVLAPFYGTKAAGDFEKLLTEHLLIGGDLVNAVKEDNFAKVDEARKKWYANADEIAKFLADINPCWNEREWRMMLYNHLDMTETEATLRLAKRYPEDIEIFEQIESEALKMADYMAQGIIKQFEL